jgi:hypothetical protein
MGFPFCITGRINSLTSDEGMDLLSLLLEDDCITLDRLEVNGGVESCKKS